MPSPSFRLQNIRASPRAPRLLTVILSAEGDSFKKRHCLSHPLERPASSKPRRLPRRYVHKRMPPCPCRPRKTRSRMSLGSLCAHRRSPRRCQLPRTLTRRPDHLRRVRTSANRPRRVPPMPVLTNLCSQTPKTVLPTATEMGFTRATGQLHFEARMPQLALRNDRRMPK